MKGVIFYCERFYLGIHNKKIRRYNESTFVLELAFNSTRYNPKTMDHHRVDCTNSKGIFLLLSKAAMY